MQSDTEWVPVDNSGFSAVAGPFFRSAATEGPVRYSFVAAEHHLNNIGIVHGGMVMTFADFAMGAAVADENGKMPTTIQLDVQFIGSARLGDRVEIACRTVSETRNMLFLDGIVSVGGVITATARGVWKKRRKKEEGQ